MSMQVLFPTLMKKMMIDYQEVLVEQIEKVLSDDIDRDLLSKMKEEAFDEHSEYSKGIEELFDEEDE